MTKEQPRHLQSILICLVGGLVFTYSAVHLTFGDYSYNIGLIIVGLLFFFGLIYYIKRDFIDPLRFSKTQSSEKNLASTIWLVKSRSTKEDSSSMNDNNLIMIHFIVHYIKILLVATVIGIFISTFIAIFAYYSEFSYLGGLTITTLIFFYIGSVTHPAFPEPSGGEVS